MTDRDDNTTTAIGCGGLLLIPLSTAAIAVRLLVAPGTPGPGPQSPYRVAARPDVQRPLTAGGLRAMGAMLGFWTLLVPVGVGVVGVAHAGFNPAGLVGMAGVVWVAMFVGHFIAMFCFKHLEPRLPHRAR